MSPLINISTLLRILNLLGGFPLRIRGRNLVFSKKMEYLKFMPTLMVLALFGCASYVVLLVEGKVTFSTLAKVTGFSLMDLLALTFSTAASMAASVFVFNTFVRKRKSLERLCQDLETFKMRAGLGDVGAIGQKRLFSINKYFFPLIWIGAGFLAATSVQAYQTMLPSDGNVALRWMYYLSSFLAVFFGFFSPAIAGGFGVSLYLVYYLSSCHDACTALHSSKDKDFVKKVGKKWQQEFVENGLELCRLGDCLEELLSPFLMSHFALSLIAGTTTTYLESNVFFGSNITSLVVSICLSFFFIGFTYIFTLYHLSSAGQSLEDARMRFRIFVSDEARSFVAPDILSLRRLDALLARKDQLSPYSFFGVNHSSFLEAMGGIFTYIIVLLQFKTDKEKSLSSSS